MVISRWGNDCLKFNILEIKFELKEFVVEIVLECVILEINFSEEGIVDYVKMFFSE